MSASLDIQKISISFGGLKAVSDFSLTLHPSELVGLIGPNGAGKTTVFNLITGVYKPDSGAILVGGKSVAGLPPYEVTASGIARTFQNVRLFKEMTILENVMVSYHRELQYGYVAMLLRSKLFDSKEALMRERALDLLSIFNLQEKADSKAGSLSYGDQRRLEIARALAASPKVLLLDEPAAGLNSQEKVVLMKTIQGIRDRFKVSILVIEHDMKLVMGICERIAVLDHGAKIAEGIPSAIRSDKKVIEAYLGVDPC